MGQTEDVEKKAESKYADPSPRQPLNSREMSSLNTERFQANLEPKMNQQSPNEQKNDERRIAVSNFASGDLQELDEKVKSMMEKSQNLIPSGRQRADICKVCGKEGAGIAIRDHIEANHLEGVSLPCNVCEKTFRSRISLRQHKCTVLQ